MPWAKAHRAPLADGGRHAGHPLERSTRQDFEALVLATDLTWTPVYSRVAGDLPAGDVPAVPAFEEGAAAQALQFQIDVTTPGAVRLKVPAAMISRLWIDRQRCDPADGLTMDLAAGTHTMTLVMGKWRVPLRIELEDAPGSKARRRSSGANSERAAECHRGRGATAPRGGKVPVCHLPGRAEPALKAEVARRWPDFRFAYSRPGFLTFKLPPDHRLPDHFDLQATFARAWGFSLGKAPAADAAERRRRFWSVAGPTQFDALHVWQRDRTATGDHGYEPGLTDLAREVADSLVQAQPRRNGAKPISANATALPGQLVLDCVLVEPGEWWVGYHRAQAASSCWPGGLFDIDLPAAAVSRAYAKIEEALAWSGLPIRRDDRVVEIGCAPGSASQALLARGLFVTGIDPADVDPGVLAHPRFTHLRKRGADVRRREFREVRWLMADMNVAPAYTLTTVGEIVTHPAVKIAGMLLTLKLINWELADEVPGYLERVRSWGFTHVAARQLAHNRQEICVAASRKV